jgi:hypothetical protein
VSLEAGVAYARTAARSGHPPNTVTHGPASPEQPLDYLLAKTAETVWEAVSAAQSELEPYLVPVRGYMTALAAKAGTSPARDFALGVLTERVRQEEDGWPDQPGDVDEGDKHIVRLISVGAGEASRVPEGRLPVGDAVLIRERRPDAVPGDCGPVCCVGCIEERPNIS